MEVTLATCFVLMLTRTGSRLAGDGVEQLGDAPVVGDSPRHTQEHLIPRERVEPSGRLVFGHVSNRRLPSMERGTLVVPTEAWHAPTGRHFGARRTRVPGDRRHQITCLSVFGWPRY